MLVFQSVTAGASISKGNAEAPKLAVLLRPCQRGPANGPHSTLPSSLQDADMAEAWMIQYRPRRHMIYITVRICITCISYADIIHVVQNRQNRIYLIERKMRRDVECRFSMFNLFQTTRRPLSQLDSNSSHG